MYRREAGYYWLERKTAIEIIKSVPDIDKLNENNRKDIIDNILKLAQDTSNIKEKESRYSPIILDILCQVLEKEIEETKRRVFDANEYTVSPKLFGEIQDKIKTVE